MKKATLISIAILALGLLGANPAQAQSAKDELNYSASACTPPTANQFHGSDRLGFSWDGRGFWVNLDDDETQTLICPVPFDPRATKADGTFGTIEVRVNVVDSSHLHELTAKLFGKTTTGDPLNDDATLLDTQFTSNAFTGATTLTLSGTPVNNIRYLWVKIDVPRVVWPAKRSAVIGYRVNRVGFN